MAREADHRVTAGLPLAMAVFLAQRWACFGKPAGMNFSIAAGWLWSPRGEDCAAPYPALR